MRLLRQGVRQNAIRTRRGPIGSMAKRTAILPTSLPEAPLFSTLLVCARLAARPRDQGVEIPGREAREAKGAIRLRAAAQHQPMVGVREDVNGHVLIPRPPECGRDVL